MFSYDQNITDYPLFQQYSLMEDTEISSGIDPIFQEMVDAGAEDIAEIIVVEAGKIGIDDSMAFGIVSAEIMAKDLKNTLDHLKHSSYTLDQTSAFFATHSHKNLFQSHTREGVRSELLDVLKDTTQASNLASVLLGRVSERLQVF